MEKLSLFMTDMVEKTGGEEVFVVSLVLITLALVVDLLITFFSAEYKRKNRVWFCLFCAGLVLLQGGLALLSGEGMGYTLLLFGVSVLYCIPVFFLSAKRRRLKKEQTDLIRFLDSQINCENRQTVFQKPNRDWDREESVREKSNLESRKASEKEDASRGEIILSLDEDTAIERPDFDHVKNVIERLNYYSLSPSDRKQIKELEINIEMAKNDLDLPELKSKINDGLTMLLKIMSKYGV